ncbi:hypothetical protein ACFL1H_06625 [Nanoarchaeota archaeon]
MSYGFGGYSAPSPSRSSSSSSRSSTPVRVSSPPRPRPQSSPEVVIDPDTGNNIYFAIGGGLSPSRIVKKMEKTDQVWNGSISNLVDYVIGHQETDEDRMVVQTIENRREKDDYMVIINGGEAEANTYLSGNVCDNTVTRQRGTVEFPFIDISIVSAEEGGLENKVK